MAKRDKDELVVYWSPYYPKTAEEKYDWNQIYAEPTPMLNDLKKYRKDGADRNNSLLHCPAFNDMYSNTWVFENLIDSKFELDKKTNTFAALQEHQIHGMRTLPEFFEGQKVLWLPLSWLFFSEESVNIEVTPPHVHPVVHRSYGSIVPGSYDISKWFRPMNTEILINKDQTRFHLPAEPIAYIRFNTTRKVVLKRFELTPEIQKIAESVADTKLVFGRFKPLSFRYETFRRTRTRDIILPKIKAALLDK
jgi:hypothetical protein